MKYNPTLLRADLLKKRLIDNSLIMDDVVNSIGISKATLSRLENGRIPDVDTLAKVCTWLNTEPNRYFSRVRKKKALNL